MFNKFFYSIIAIIFTAAPLHAASTEDLSGNDSQVAMTVKQTVFAWQMFATDITTFLELKNNERTARRLEKTIIASESFYNNSEFTNLADFFEEVPQLATFKYDDEDYTAVPTSTPTAERGWCLVQ